MHAAMFISRRKYEPSHYLLKIESFSILYEAKKCNIESDVFEASGHNWSNNYVTFQDVNGHRTRFHEKKTTWGFDKLISLDYFADIEILALPEFTRLDWCLSMTKPPETMNTFTWTINRFSDVTDECVSSEVFKLVKVKWYMKLWVYPKGNNSGEGTHLSIYLGVDDVALFPDGWKLYQNSNSGLKVNLPKGIERKVTSVSWYH
ncbi:hypothetical protein R6Q59_000244, partial [Mikania micrantha]